MLKIFNLAKNLAKPLPWTSGLFLNFQFHTLKAINSPSILLKAKELTYKSQNFVGARMKKPNSTPYRNWRVIKGDKIIMLSGKDKGKQGTVLRAYRKQNMVLVSGINIVQKT